MVDRWKPFFCEFIGQDCYRLLVGIGGDLGCVQHSLYDGSPPYLMATNNGEFDTSDLITFMIGNTPSSVPRCYCLPIELVKRIACNFLETGQRSTEVRWEPVRSIKG